MCQRRSDCAGTYIHSGRANASMEFMVGDGALDSRGKKLGLRWRKRGKEERKGVDRIYSRRNLSLGGVTWGKSFEEPAQLVDRRATMTRYHVATIHQLLSYSFSLYTHLPRASPCTCLVISLTLSFLPPYTPELPLHSHA